MMLMVQARSTLIVGCICVFLVGCVAQQADLIRLKKDLDARITELDLGKKQLELAVANANKAIDEANQVAAQQKAELEDLIRRARADLRQEVKAVRDEQVPKVRGEIEVALHDIQELKGEMQADNQRVDVRIQALEAQLAEEREDIGALKAKAETFGDEIDRQGAAVMSQLSTFQQSFEQFKGTLQELSEKIIQEENRATYTEADLTTRLGKSAEVTTAHLVEVNESIDSLARALQGLESDSQANAAQLQDVTQSLGQLRGVLDSAGSTLGNQVDQNTDQLRRLDQSVVQVSELEKQVKMLSSKIETDTQATSTHLGEVTNSVNSVAKALESSSGTLATRLDDQSRRLNELETHLGTLQGIQGDLQNRGAHFQDISQSLTQFQAALDTVSGTLGQQVDQQSEELTQVKNRLAQFEQHQASLTEKLTNDTQVTSAHLAEVNASVHSVAQSLTEVHNALKSKIADQEIRLADASGSLQRVKSVDGELAENVAHLNELTKTVNQLRSVINTIGTKLGEKVDQHEEQLARLAKQLATIQGSKPKR